MDKQSRTYQAYVQILKEELIPAMGCTEPIAIAYAAAKARDVLGGMPDKVEIGVSSNIIKNVKSVIVPNTDGMKGIEAAAAAGIVGGQADKALEVIAAVTTDQKAAMRAFLTQVPVTVKAIDNGFIFDIIVTLRQGDDSAVVRICQYHTNIVLIQRNSEVLLDHTAQETKQLCGDAAPAESGLTDRALLNIADIFAFYANFNRSRRVEQFNPEALKKLKSSCIIQSTCSGIFLIERNQMLIQTARCKGIPRV